MLLDARYEDSGLPMEEEQVIDEILILLIAGHETTANALSWSLYLLANHPDEQEKLQLSTSGLSVEASVASDELNCVINEAMRLYPPAWISDRVSLSDDQYKDYTFPRDIIIILFYYGLHRDRKYWDDPAAFKPERFLQFRRGKEKPKAFLPIRGRTAAVYRKQFCHGGDGCISSGGDPALSHSSHRHTSPDQTAGHSSP